MKLGVPRETFPGERRVSIIPAQVPNLIKLGYDVVVEQGAGDQAGFPDALYRDKGATLVAERRDVLTADVVTQVRSAGATGGTYEDDLPLFRDGTVVIGMCDPLGAADALDRVASHGVRQFALELIPRTTRAQSMDVLSSMATIAGYRAVLLAAVELPKIFPMMMTAAGTLAPAKVFVVGAGVAGLQAIATAKRLGAVVSGYDLRAATKEQVESVGGKFIILDLDTSGAEGQGGYAKAMDEEFYRRQREQLGNIVADSDVVITTAAVPGKTSPLLVTGDAVRRMRAGSVIVDLAAERGGNVEPSKPDERVVEAGVTILGPTNIVSDVPQHASQMYGTNLVNLLKLITTKEKTLHLNPHDDIVRETLVTYDRQIVQPRIRSILGQPALAETDNPFLASAPNDPAVPAGKPTGSSPRADDSK